MHTDLRHTTEKGFTIVELLVVVSILVGIVIVLFQSLFTLIRSSAIDRTAIHTTYDVQNALSIIEGDALLTTTFLHTTDPDVTDAYKPSSNEGQWSHFGDTPDSPTRVLIMRAYSTTTNPLSPDREPAFLSTGGCSPSEIYTNDVLQYNIIYFVDDGNLYRRRALDTTQPTCVPPYQKQSCPSLETLGTSTRDSTCGADDELLATDVSAFSVEYYPSTTSSNPIEAYDTGEFADPESVTAASSAEVTITITRETYGEEIASTSSIRVSKINAVSAEEEL